MVASAEQELLRRKLVKTGDVVGVVAGTQQAAGATNFMRMHVVIGETAGRSGSPSRPARKLARKRSASAGT